MAELGAGPHRSGAIADCLKREVSPLGSVRSSLIAKGMIWSPGHGDTAFTVPLFDEFMRRIMSGDDWRAQAIACQFMAHSSNRPECLPALKKMTLLRSTGLSERSCYRYDIRGGRPNQASAGHPSGHPCRHANRYASAG